MKFADWGFMFPETPFRTRQRRYNIRKCNYKKNASISKNISIFLKFSPKITILYKVSPKQSNYDRERKEETGNVRTAIC